MRKDIILSGVGGQGILTIATIIGEAATAEGINLKQAEVHGMSQRGGDVQSNLRLSDETIYSDLIAQGEADLIISMEPMEALRYLPYLQEEGWVITSANPFKNIPDYPEEVDLMKTLESLPHMVKLEIEDMALPVLYRIQAYIKSLLIHFNNLLTFCGKHTPYAFTQLFR